MSSVCLLVWCRQSVINNALKEHYKIKKHGKLEAAGHTGLWHEATLDCGIRPHWLWHQATLDCGIRPHWLVASGHTGLWHQATLDCGIRPHWIVASDHTGLWHHAILDLAAGHIGLYQATLYCGIRPQWTVASGHTGLWHQATLAYGIRPHWTVVSDQYYVCVFWLYNGPQEPLSTIMDEVEGCSVFGCKIKNSVQTPIVTVCTDGLSLSLLRYRR